MKIIDIFNLPRKNTYPLKDIIILKDWGKSIFPVLNNIGIDWEKLNIYSNLIQGYNLETELNTFYMIFLNHKPLILVNYDKVMQYYVPYCVDRELYEHFIKILLSCSDLSYCSFHVQNDTDIVLPNEDKYYETYGDLD